MKRYSVVTDPRDDYWVVADPQDHPSSAVNAASYSDAKSLINNRARWTLGWQVRKAYDDEWAKIFDYILAHNPPRPNPFDCF